MYLFHDLKLIYIIVPGTGSNSFHESLKVRYKNWERVRVALSHPAWGMDMQISNPAHFTSRQARIMIEPPHWNHYKKIAFVRHPYDWINCLYNKGGLKNSIGEDNSVPIHTFIRNLKITPYHWFTDIDGSLLIDTIYRTEDLNTILLNTFECVPKHLNSSGGRRWAFSDDDKTLIKEKFYREFEHYA